MCLICSCALTQICFTDVTGDIIWSLKPRNHKVISLTNDVTINRHHLLKKITYTLNNSTSRRWVAQGGWREGGAGWGWVMGRTETEGWVRKMCDVDWFWLFTKGLPKRNISTVWTKIKEKRCSITHTGARNRFMLLCACKDGVSLVQKALRTNMSENCSVTSFGDWN